MQTTDDFILSAKDGNEMCAKRSLAFAGGLLALGITSGLILSFYSYSLLVIVVLIFFISACFYILTYVLNRLENRKLTNLQIALEDATSKEEVISTLNFFAGK